MKKYLVLIASIALLNTATAQKTGDIIKQSVKQTTNNAAQSAANKATEKVLTSLFSKKNKHKNESINTPTTPANNSSNGNSSNGQANTNTNDNAANNSSTPSLKTYSKFDFVPGDKVLVYEDFAQDAVGDFPDKWNTNSSGEIVTTSGIPGHWLMLDKKGLFLPEFINKLPENFTLEFDLMYVGSNPWLYLYLLTGGHGEGALKYDINNRSGVEIGIQPIPRDQGGLAHIYSYDNGGIILDNQTQFQNNGATKLKVSIWRQNQRLRVYLDQDKVFDLPRAFPAGKDYNMAMFYLPSEFEKDNKYLISNIKLAAGAPDTRNKLLTEGKFSTTGILFDVNSATIKPESYGSLKDIASVLQENANMHVKIVGHTDNDGDAAMNVGLSKKRAEAVKQVLVSEFNIDDSRMQTDGKGESDPIANNSTAAGKAQNRRVEFVKM